MRLFNTHGFTLAELLIALAILGVIATFTIPKILLSQQNSTYEAAYKEAIGTVAAAYESYKLKNTLSVNTSPADLTPYINYVKVDTVSKIDHVPYGNADEDCAVYTCLVLHSGAKMLAPDASTVRFGGTASTNFITFMFDPNGKLDSTDPAGPGKSLNIILYYNGRITSGDNRKASDVTYHFNAPASWGGDSKPDWFDW